MKHPLTKYIEEAVRTESRDFGKIAGRLVANSPRKVQLLRLLHAMMGLVTEAGEFCDQLKTHIFYGKELDVTNLVEECGDLHWYLALAFDAMNEMDGGGDAGELWQQALDLNIAKLKARYPDKFDEKKAVNRDHEKEREALES